MKKILIPVDDSIHSTHAVQYAMMMSPILDETAYLLFHVQPRLSDYIREEAKKDPVAMAKLEQVNAKNLALGNEILNRHRARMITLQVPEQNIRLSTQQLQEGVARDILQKARREVVDAVVMGRRGFSKLQETFIGSTTKNVIEHNTDFPVWVVDEEITSRNILLAVDGSTDSVKALDHLFDMMRRNPDVKLTLFHVQPSMRDCCGIDFAGTQDAEDEKAVADIIEKADRRCIDNFLAYVRRKQQEKEIHENSLALKTQPTRFNVGRTILEEFREGGYGTLVVGRRGVNKRFFMGSVSNYLVTRLEKGALWIVP